MIETTEREAAPGGGRRLTSPWLFGALFVVTLVLDQVIKAYVRNVFAVHEAPGYPFPGIFELTLTYNKGIAFGMLPGLGVIFAPVACLIAYLAFRYCLQNPGESRLTHVALSLLASGAVGNLIDRTLLGKVTDMFWFRAINFPVFNFADACITFGAILLGLRLIFESKPKAKVADLPIKEM